MLTAQQQQTVAENEKLIYWALRKLHKSIDEYYGIGAIGLCKAVKKWNPEKSSLSTFAFLCIRSEILMEYRKEKEREYCVSLDEPIGADGNITLGDTIRAEDDIAKLEERETLSRAIRALKTETGEKESEVLLMWINGKKQREIADKVNLSQPYVSRIVKRCQTKLAKKIAA